MFIVGSSALGKSIISGKEPFLANFSRSKLLSLSIVTLTSPVPFSFKSKISAALEDKSIILSFTKGPLSLILKIIDLLFCKLVTLTALGKGSVL